MEQGVSWRLAVDRIPGLLGIDHAEFYQCIYAAANEGRGTVDYSTLTRTFDQESVGELVDLLELQAGPRAEEALVELGAFIPHPLRVELTSVLFETARRQAREHSVDKEAFRGMLDVFGAYESARDAYLAEYFSRDEIVYAAAGRFVRERSFRVPDLACESAVDVLARMFRSHILELQTVLVSVGLTLFDIAVDAGYVRSYEEEAAAERGGSHAHRYDREVQRRVSWACDVLELRPENTDLSTVRRAYKRLMLRYHPDVNPRGLHKAKQINRAYSVLLEVV
ncbi:MAG: J domain-containing protein [Spirochaetia bacterium]